MSLDVIKPTNEGKGLPSYSELLREALDKSTLMLEMLQKGEGQEMQDYVAMRIKLFQDKMSKVTNS